MTGHDLPKRPVTMLRNPHLAVVLDLHARRVIGWAFSAKPDSELVIKALDMACEQRAKP